MTEEQALRRLERWVETYQPIVYRAAYMIVKDRDTAEDIAQDTFMRAWRAADRVQDEDGVRPWLYRIAVNTALSHLRKKKRERAAVARLRPATSHDPSDASDTAEVVGEAIDRLPDHLRVTVICRYYLDLSERESARVLNVRPGTVKSRLHEARRLLSGDDVLAAAAGA